MSEFSVPTGDADIPARARSEQEAAVEALTTGLAPATEGDSAAADAAETGLGLAGDSGGYLTDETAHVEQPAVAAEVAEEDPVAELRRELEAAPGEWYVVHSYAGYENKVKANLESRITSLNMEDYIYRIEVPPRRSRRSRGASGCWFSARSSRATCWYGWTLSLIHISEPTRLGMISYAVFC